MSASTADALEFLLEMGVKEFQGCEETIKYIRAINDIFDFTNSQNLYQKGMKSPLTFKNLEEKSKRIVECLEFLYGITLENKKSKKIQQLHKHPKNTFLIGFACLIKSIFQLAPLLLPNSAYFNFILTYHFSQDFLEIFFGLIRGRFGCNNNRNSTQFKYALRRILMQNYIKMSPNSNVQAINSNIGSVFSIGKNRSTQPPEDKEREFSAIDPKFIELLKCQRLTNSIEDATNCIMYYIGGFVVRRLLPSLACDSCISAIYDEKKLLRGSTRGSTFAKFAVFKNKYKDGGNGKDEIKRGVG
jgi:hypothetical protein